MHVIPRRERVLAYAGWLVPPLVAAAANLPWWASLLLLVPATAWYVRIRSRESLSEASAWDRFPIMYALPGVVAIALVIPGLSGLSRYTGCFAASLLILADLFRGGHSGSTGWRRRARDADMSQ
jgi:hypothetical protein